MRERSRVVDEMSMWVCETSIDPQPRISTVIGEKFVLSRKDHVQIKPLCTNCRLEHLRRVVALPPPRR